jgi:phage terminase small subunit
MQEIARIAFQDARKYFDENGNLIPVQLLDDDAAAALAGMDIDELFEYVDGVKMKIGLTKKIKRYDKNKALEMLAKHFKLYGEVEQPQINFNFSNLSADELKTLLDLKRKLAA